MNIFYNHNINHCIYKLYQMSYNLTQVNKTEDKKIF
jgi:hypothetical protein